MVLQSLLYHGEALQNVSALLQQSGFDAASLKNALENVVRAGSTPAKAEKNVADIVPGVEAFLVNPDVLEIDVLPDQSETYAEFQKQLNATGGYIDYLGISVHKP